MEMTKEDLIEMYDSFAYWYSDNMEGYYFSDLDFPTSRRDREEFKNGFRDFLQLMLDSGVLRKDENNRYYSTRSK